MNTSPETLGIEQLAERVGMSVRTVRFYAGRGLIPPPRREGRNGYYGPDHIARLDLVRELQAHGFTLQAIEGYLDKIPAAATPEEVALHRTLLAPWMPDLPETVQRTELEKRTGRRLSDDNLELLVALGVIEPTPREDVFKLAPAHLTIGIAFLDAELPTPTVRDARKVILQHGSALAAELTELFREQVWPHLVESGHSPEYMTTMIERFKPLTIQALVTAYEQAVDEQKRETVRRRT